MSSPKPKPTMKNTPWAKDIMKEAAYIMDALDVNWWLECGALLGIYRDGHLIDHDDPDIDFTVLEPADHPKIEEAFVKEGYTVYAQGEHQQVFQKRGVLVDISFYVLENDDLIMRVHGAGRAVQPYSLFNPLGEVEFDGRKYPTTNDVEAYLEQRYGDWWVPQKEKRPWTEPGEHLVWQPDKVGKVITYGTFDCLHYGHIRLLERAKSLGEHLTVGLSTDKFNKEKGKESIFTYRQREKDLRNLRCVDDVIPEDSWGQKYKDVVEKDIELLVMGSDWEGKFDDVQCRVQYLPRTPGVSSTKIRQAL